MSSPTSFYDLPAEIRHIIYDYALEDTFIRFEYDVQRAFDSRPPYDAYWRFTTKVMTADEMWPMPEAQKKLSLKLAEGTLPCQAEALDEDVKVAQYRAVAVGSPGIVFASLATHNEALYPWLQKATFKTYGWDAALMLGRCCPKAWLPHIKKVIEWTDRPDACEVPIHALPALSSYEVVWTQRINPATNYIFQYRLDHPRLSEEVDLRLGVAIVGKHLELPGLELPTCWANIPGQAGLVDYAEVLGQAQALSPVPKIRITVTVEQNYDEVKAWLLGRPEPPQGHHELEVCIESA